VYAEDLLTWENFTVLLGARSDTHDQFGSYFTYRLTPSYFLAETQSRFKATLGTAFNAPTLYQLYSPYGNIKLKPEISQGWDVGVEQTLLSGPLKAGLTYFQSKFADQIDFYTISYDPTTYEIKGEYRNLNRVETKGWEASLEAKPADTLTVRLAYSKLTANDLTQESTIGPLPLIRRADYRLALTALYNLSGFSGCLKVEQVDPRWDTDFLTYERIVLAPYTLANLLLAYDMTAWSQVYVRVQNMLDAFYAEVSGYGTSRFATYVGVKIIVK
jgi:vitamin B12 transporter